MEKKTLGYVYYSASGFEKHSEYGHPEIRVFEFCREEKETWFAMGNLIFFTSQVDSRHKMPYALRATIIMEGYRSDALKWAGKLDKYLQKNCFYGLSIRNIIRFIQSHKMIRFINTSWLKDIPSKYQGYWIPYQYRKAAVAYVDALRAGII